MDLQDYHLDIYRRIPVFVSTITLPVEKDGGEEDFGGVSVYSGPRTASVGVTNHPLPSAPVMPVEDVNYLKNLGLMDY